MIVCDTPYGLSKYPGERAWTSTEYEELFKRCQYCSDNPDTALLLFINAFDTGMVCDLLAASAYWAPPQLLY